MALPALLTTTYPYPLRHAVSCALEPITTATRKIRPDTPVNTSFGNTGCLPLEQAKVLHAVAIGHFSVGGAGGAKL